MTLACVRSRFHHLHSVITFPSIWKCCWCFYSVFVRKAFVFSYNPHPPTVAQRNPVTRVQTKRQNTRALQMFLFRFLISSPVAYIFACYFVIDTFEMFVLLFVCATHSCHGVFGAHFFQRRRCLCSCVVFEMKTLGRRASFSSSRWTISKAPASIFHCMHPQHVNLAHRHSSA